jgi:hypothetical protein
MEICPVFMAAALLKAPQADIMHDRFHVAKHLNEAADAVRKRENAGLGARLYDWLGGRIFLKSPGSWKKGERCCFAELQKNDLQVTKAWGLPENLAHFRAFAMREGARSFFEQWHGRARRSDLGPRAKRRQCFAGIFPGSSITPCTPSPMRSPRASTPRYRR